ncbi:putative sodium-coupled neutral amino acid transporter 11 isoform X1 [Anguilla anguilla]|uniref:putative sodium-coupled neutral amino acid transporter 11 isoform X1 n=2 Tax=Anguilla anguilla TaxID=7936 RepID=UPI0015AAA056|nr:putative sodium-coupled neutral amino acid transporter 11 isoform X1 [Anguilla anguilla]
MSDSGFILRDTEISLKRGVDQHAQSVTLQTELSERKSLISPQNELGEGGTSSMPAASFNFINSIIGSGIIGLPYSMNQAGLPLGMLLMILVACITDYSIILLIKGGQLSGTRSYQALVQSTFGFTGYLILSVLQFVYPFIAMVSYNIITGDTLTKVFQRIPGVGPDHMLAERHFVILVTTVVFTLPLSLHRDISKLGKVSLLSMVLTLVVLVTVVIRAATLGPQIPPTENAWSFAHWNAIQAVGVMSFAFICHHNSFMIYGSLEEPTLRNWSRVTHVSVSSAVLVSLLFAAAGYATFTGYTQGDIFENYCRNDDLATLGRFCYGISVITTFPLECFVTREVTSNLFFNGTLGTAAHCAVTVVIVALATAISLASNCLSTVLELNGALSATPLIFIIPSACHLRLSTGRWLQWENLISCLILLSGVFVMIVGVTMTALYPQDCSHGTEMFYCSSSNLSVARTTSSANPNQSQNLSQDASQFT